jgi:hypothetical protein
LPVPGIEEARAQVEADREAAQARGDDHLRSSKEVIGYHIQATDGELGHVEDFLIKDPHEGTGTPRR